ncbi:MAG: CocE/NonD family hydrolase [Hyphomicrobiales bacterium]|nr:CocE/NonD family hydrolase [Hyphomicrobiales bacterium]
MREQFFKIIEDEKITLSSGINLYAKIWVPVKNASPLPALLEYLPYRRRDGTALRDENRYAHFVKNGFAGVRVDIRGNGDSEGIMLDEYTKEELQDGYEVIEWIAKQPWCNGHVGMMGISWGGFNSLQIAALQPPSLKAIIAVAATDDRYADDVHYKGGCLASANITWAAQMLSYSSRPPDYEIVGNVWQNMWRERLDNMPLLIENWLNHQLRDDFWKHGSVCEDYSNIRIPVLSVGGWADCYKNPVFRLKKNLKSLCSAIMGPWEHAYPDIASNGHKIDFLEITCDWWNKHLQDTNSNEDSYTHFFIQDYDTPSRFYKKTNGFWASVDINEDIEIQTLYLSGNWQLSKIADRDDATITIDSPVHLGMGATVFCPGMRTDEEIADNQKEDDALSQYFETDIAEEDYIIAGRPEFVFEIASTANAANVIARLCDVSPNGDSHIISLGCLNLNHNETHEKAGPLKEKVYYPYKFLLDVCGYRIKKGHRLRLSLSNHYWPLLWPSPRQGVLYLKTGTASLNLPLLTRYDKIEMTEMKSSNQAQRVQKQPRKYQRDNVHENGVFLLQTFDDFGVFLDERTSISAGSTVKEIFSIEENNPLSAKVRAEWKQILSRDENWDTETKAVTEVTCDEQYFFIFSSLETYHAKKLFFRREWSKKVKRHYT